MTALSANDLNAKSAKKSTTVHVEFDSLNRQIGKKKRLPYMLSLTALSANSAKKGYRYSSIQTIK